MSLTLERNRITEFGDFQTPPELAIKVCDVISRLNVQPVSLLEPTCGVGNLLFAAVDSIPSLKKVVGVDVFGDYVKAANQQLSKRKDKEKVQILKGDFFEMDWSKVCGVLPDPLLVIGNPPWVTNAGLSVLGSSNLPAKTNFQHLTGLDAKMGKSNFDISEWMLIRMLHWLERREAVMAMLCKTSVARKVLSYAWKNDVPLSYAAIHTIDAKKYFGVAVDACLLVCKFSPNTFQKTGHIFEGLESTKPESEISMVDGQLVACVEKFERWKYLQGESPYKWRSGIKHDCAKVMELTKEGEFYRNGLGKLVELEDTYLHPMLKSSDVVNGLEPKRWMLVTQKSVREDTMLIKHTAPKTWRYLLDHAEMLNKRGSSIYKKRSPFSIFGVGDYSFSTWKVAISGLYKRLTFQVVGCYDAKPTVLDDTCYFISCQNKEEAVRLASLLNSQTAKEFFEAFIFWDAKRPITVDILQRLNIAGLEAHMLQETLLFNEESLHSNLLK